MSLLPPYEQSPILGSPYNETANTSISRFATGSKVLTEDSLSSKGNKGNHYEGVSSPPVQHSANEGFTPEDLTIMYSYMTNNASKYDMGSSVILPSTHPDYTPSFKDIVLYDINQQVTQQYNTIYITIAATVSLGFIAYMVSSNPSE